MSSSTVAASSSILKGTQINMPGKVQVLQAANWSHTSSYAITFGSCLKYFQLASHARTTLKSQSTLLRKKGTMDTE